MGCFEGPTEKREDSDDGGEGEDSYNEGGESYDEVRESYDEGGDEVSWEPTEKVDSLDGIPKDDGEFGKWLVCVDGYSLEEDEDGMDTD